MDILAALRQEKGRLQHQLKGIQIAIAALNGHSRATIRHSQRCGTKENDVGGGTSRDFKATKARWAKFRAEKAEKAK
jgi:hypothetical protein